MSKLDKDTVLEAFTKAYQEKHGKAPDIDAKGGWYSVDGGKKVRLAEIDTMAKEMTSGETATEEKAEDVKPKAEAKKPAAKPKKKKVKEASQFSVKDFYAQQILAKYPGSKVPR